MADSPEHSHGREETQEGVNGDAPTEIPEKITAEPSPDVVDRRSSAAEAALHVEGESTELAGGGVEPSLKQSKVLPIAVLVVSLALLCVGVYSLAGDIGQSSNSPEAVAGVSSNSVADSESSAESDDSGAASAASAAEAAAQSQLSDQSANRSGENSVSAGASGVSSRVSDGGSSESDVAASASASSSKGAASASGSSGSSDASDAGSAAGAGKASDSDTTGNSSSGGNSSDGGSAATDSDRQQAAANTITVSVSVSSSAVGSPVSASAKPAFNQGATVYDALCACGLSVNAAQTQFGIYVSAIGGLSEKEHGSTSGWMYSVNGSVPMTSCSNYVLADGDVVSWYYVTDEG